MPFTQLSASMPVRLALLVAEKIDINNSSLYRGSLQLPGMIAHIKAGYRGLFRCLTFLLPSPVRKLLRAFLQFPTSVRVRM